MKKPIFAVGLILLGLSAFAQTIVTGTITDAQGEGVPGVNVVIEDTSNGTVTDFNGDYTIEVNSNDVLIFSFIGYITDRQEVGTRSTIDLVLVEDVTSLSEVIVVGYGVQKKSVASAAISSIDSEELEGRPVPRADEMLQGQVTGITVKSASGSPGASTNIFIRGIGTNGDNSALLVIDGLVGGNLRDLNPSDIESIQVLKDAASSAIYGARGANGVIIVTTKKGVDGKVQLSYDGNYSIQAPWKKPEMMNSSQYVTAIREKFINGGQPIQSDFPDQSTILNDTDWMDEIFTSSPVMSHNISVSNGGPKGSFFSSIAYLSQKGVVAPEKSNYERFNIRLNSKSDITSYLSFGENFSLIHSDFQSIPENSAFGTPIADALVYDPTTGVSDPLAQFGFAQSPFVQKEYVNPLSRIYITNNDSKTDQVLGNVYLQINIYDGLSFRTDLGIDYLYSMGKSYSPKYALTNSFVNENNSVSQSTYNRFQWQWENYLTYEKSFDKNNFNIVVGMSALEANDVFFGGSRQNIPLEVADNPNWQYISAGADSTDANYGGANPKYSLSSLFGRISYNFDEKYLFTATVRRDGSSNFGPNSRYGIFPSFSAGWVISNEEFFNTKFVEILKVRGSWGKNGNDRIGSLNFVSTVVPNGRPYEFGKPDDERILEGASPANLANPNLKWEESIQWDIGVETDMFAGRFSLELDYFQKTTRDLLISASTSTPILAGNQAPLINAGEIRNSGFEFNGRYNETFGEFRLGLGLLFSTLKNQVNEVLGDGFINGYTWPVRNTVISRMEAGQPVGYFLGYKTDGVFKNESEVFSYVNSDGDLIQPDAAPGDLKFVDNDGDGQITFDDRTFIGKPWADITFGFNGSANYKNFDLSFLISASVGNEIYRTYERQDVPYNNYQIEWLDRWSESNPNGSYPRLSTSSGNATANNNSPSDFYVEDGSFVRMKNLQFGYSIPENILKKLKMQKLRIYFSAANVFTITGYTGFDPEIGTSGWILDTGIDKGFYPQPRTFGGGLNLTF